MRRRQLLDMLTAEKNRRSSAAKRLQKPIEAHIAWLIADLARVALSWMPAIRQSPVWREQDDLLQSIPASVLASVGRDGRTAGVGYVRAEAARGPRRSGAPQPR